MKGGGGEREGSLSHGEKYGTKSNTNVPLSREESAKILLTSSLSFFSFISSQPFLVLSITFSFFYSFWHRVPNCDIDKFLSRKEKSKC